MDLLFAVVVWLLGTWLAYRWARHIPGHPHDREPRRHQEGMDVRWRRGPR